MVIRQCTEWVVVTVECLVTVEWPAVTVEWLAITAGL